MSESNQDDIAKKIEEFVNQANEIAEEYNADIEESPLDLGTCCACEGTWQVQNIFLLDVKGPTPGLGWGCLACGLPFDGAFAVMCEACLEAKADLRFVCAAKPHQPGRGSATALRGQLL